MTGLGALIKRDTKLFFKDKGMFFTSLITPIILLVLFATFLGNVYEESFTMNLPEGMAIPEKLIRGTVGGQLVSSLLAVCCVTVAFCSNMLMVQDKLTGARGDLTITPVRSSAMALGYFISTAITTLIICLAATGVGLAYLAVQGWFLTTADILLILLDVTLLTLFGTALSSIVNFFLSSQGQISAVGTIVSAGYGFICGAYMPISQFGEGLRSVLSYLPGTYGTSLIRNHCLRGAYEEMSVLGFPDQVIESIKDAIDCNLYFGGQKVELGSMYIILVGSVAVLIAVYVLMNVLLKRKRKG